MTGLNLETFLHLLRADLGAWATLGLIGLVLALMAWTSWGSRRALRKCLVLSVVAHVGLALYGGTVPVVLLALNSDEADAARRDRIREIKVVPVSAPETSAGGRSGDGVGGSGGLAPWDRPSGGLALADRPLAAIRSVDAPEVVLRPGERPALPATAAAPEGNAPAPPPAEPRPHAAGQATESASAPTPRVAPSGEDDVAPAAVVRAEPPPAAPGRPDPRLRPDRIPAHPAAAAPVPLPALAAATAEPAALAMTAPEALADRPADPRTRDPGPAAGTDAAGTDAARPNPDEAGVGPVEVVARPVDPLPVLSSPEGDVRRRSRPAAGSSPTAEAPLAHRPPGAAGALTLPRVTPGGVPALPEIQGAVGGRPLADVPEVYRSRLDPNRSARAFRSGASPASEQAVERALDWLARHQDADGRWDGATAHYDDGTPVRGDDDFTVHCPAGEVCFGECFYWEADTALTGLALLAYLGAGYTQSDGKYAQTVGKGLDFLLARQKPDGDLRGSSRAVGMYCHAMATIALCEAYALTGDERLRPPVERAVGFLVRARARDGLAWRYAPGEPDGDTSILGWVVMALKSAREVGIEVPSDVQKGTLGWLAKVASGPAGGRARYRTDYPVTPTMTAEAWACRQFLGVGGPGPASTEAADYLLAHGPTSDPYNLYYWYYGTLAMYQHGGDAWYRWNAQVRDDVIRRQRPRGHAVGSWDPDDSPYGAKGGRIYCTALATLSLEVYYRYLRLYDEPNIPPAIAPRRSRGGDRDPAVGRLEPNSPRNPQFPAPARLSPLR